MCTYVCTCVDPAGLLVQVVIIAGHAGHVLMIMCAEPFMLVMAVHFSYLGLRTGTSHRLGHRLYSVL